MILYIRNEAKEAIGLIKSLELSRNEYHAIGVGGRVCGYGYDTIIFDVDFDSLPIGQQETYNKWKRDIISRLNNPKKGKIIHLQ